MTTATDRHGLEVLPMAQCFALLRSRPLGRLAYVASGTPTVVPVNHLVDGSAIVIRSFAGAKLHAALLEAPVAFQLDDHDPSRGTGWSVLATGRATIVDDDDQIARYEADLDSWAMGDVAPDAVTWIRVVPDEVSGRRLRRTHTVA